MISKIPPMVCSMVKISTGTWWCGGTGICLRSAQYFSPNTALDPQWSRLLGLGNNVGLTINQITRTAIGIRQYHPIHILDQTASTKNGKVANLVHTDHGLACFIQLSPWRLNTCAICFSMLMLYG